MKRRDDHISQIRSVFFISEVVVKIVVLLSLIGEYFKGVTLLIEKFD